MSVAAIAIDVKEEFKTGSFLRLVDVPIEDVRGLGEKAVARLRAALAGGVPFAKDRKRRGLYEVQAAGERFYIYVLRGAQKVLLLGRLAE
jgi:hypothetical protein